MQLKILTFLFPPFTWLFIKLFQISFQMKCCYLTILLVLLSIIHSCTELSGKGGRRVIFSFPEDLTTYFTLLWPHPQYKMFTKLPIFPLIKPTLFCAYDLTCRYSSVFFKLTPFHLNITGSYTDAEWYWVVFSSDMVKHDLRVTSHTLKT